MHKEDFIEYKEAKKGSQPLIQKINYRNTELHQWVITLDPKSIMKESEQKKENYGFKPIIIVTELFKPNQTINFIFKNEPKDKYYTRDEWVKILLDYVQNECEKQKKLIKITDPYLAQLFNQSSRVELKHDQSDLQFQNLEQFQLISKDDLIKEIQNHFKIFHEVQQQNTRKFELRQGHFQGLNLIAEKNHNRNVTKITGLEIFGFDPNLKVENNPNSFLCLSNYFQLKYACSVSIHDLPGKNQGKEMVVHGNFLTELISFFNDECQIDPKFIHSINKLKPKKKQQ